MSEPGDSFPWGRVVFGVALGVVVVRGAASLKQDAESALRADRLRRKVKLESKLATRIERDQARLGRAKEATRKLKLEREQRIRARLRGGA